MKQPKELIVRCLPCNTPMVLEPDGTLPLHRDREGNPCYGSGTANYCKPEKPHGKEPQ